MSLFGIALAVYAAVLVFDRIKAKKVSYLVHVQGRTEADEHMDMAVSLFEGEEDQWDAKLSAAFELREKRLRYQNDRMLKLQEEQRLEFEKAKKKPSGEK